MCASIWPSRACASSCVRASALVFASLCESLCVRSQLQVLQLVRPLRSGPALTERAPVPRVLSFDDSLLLTALQH